MLEDLAVVICTRNRTEDALKALRSIIAQEPPPIAVILVDSSDDMALRDKLSSFTAPFRVHYIKSAAGLPFQRNVALDFAAANSLSFLVFMDDDVTLCSPGSLSTLRMGLFDPTVALVAPFDRALPPVKKSRIRRLLHLGDLDTEGRILRTGVCVPVPLATQALELLEVEWVPGLCFGVRVKDGMTVRFPEYIKFFGEDVEFQAHLARQGRFVMLPSAIVSHEPSGKNRADPAEARYWDLTFKFRLAALYPQVTKFWILIYAVASSVHYALIARNLREYIAFERSTVQALFAGLGGRSYGNERSA